ncbi:MAG: hypothetical protein ACLFMZ_09535, partial [Spirochaetaceae bacterium]
PIGESDIMDMFPEILADKDCTGTFRGMILLLYGGTLINYRGNYKMAEQVLKEGLELSRMTGDAHLKLQCYITSSYLDYFLGNFYEALQKLKSAGKMLEETGDVYSIPHVALGKCSVFTALGKSEEACELVEPMLQSLNPLQNSYNLYMPYVTAARVKMLNGLWEDAVNYIERGLCRYPHNGMLLGYRIMLEYIQGNIERGDSLARYLSALNRGIGSGPYMFHIHASAVQTVRALCTGETAELRKTVVQLRGVTMHPHKHPFILVRAHILLCIIASLLNDADLASIHYNKLQHFDRYHLVRPYFKYRALSRAAHCMGNHRKAEQYMGKALESAIYYHDLPMEAVLHYESVIIRLNNRSEDAVSGELRDSLCKALFQATEIGMELLKNRVELLCNKLYETRENGAALHFHLTKREKEILRLVGEARPR